MEKTKPSAAANRHLVGHIKVTAGTLGAFVKRQGSDEIFMLSSNHVLTNEDRAKIGDAVVQAGSIDGY